MGAGALSVSCIFAWVHDCFDKSILKALLQGVAWLLFAIAAFAFFWGGRAISEFAKTERILAELEGLLLAAVCEALGAWAKVAFDNIDEGDG